MRREATQGSTSTRWQRCLERAARAVASILPGLRVDLDRRDSREEDTPGARATAVPDGGREESADATDPEETAFVWGQTRDVPDDDEGPSPDATVQRGEHDRSTPGQREERDRDSADEREAHPTDVPNPHRTGTDGPPESAFQAIEDRLDVLAETAEHLSILAMNANLKLAREEPSEIPGIVYDVEADAKSLRRAIEDVESRVDRLRHQFREQPGAAADIDGDAGGPDVEGRAGDDDFVDRDDDSDFLDRDDDGDPGDLDDDGDLGRQDGDTEHGTRDGTSDLGTRDGEVRPRVGGRDGRTVGRTSTQLPAGDRQPSGPWWTAGVDLTNWPGHLARLDFEQIKEQVTSSETVTTGSVPPAVAEYSLDDRELPFEALLSLSAASGPGQPSVDDGVATDEDD